WWFNLFYGYSYFVPGFMQIGPGFDVVGLPQFGGRWMMMLAVIIPQFIVFTVINHWCYLKQAIFI
ncbi:Kmt1, partial [Pasteurella multocida subsp. multocida str. Anand1_buffalo]